MIKGEVGKWHIADGKKWGDSERIDRTEETS
jgi:hypothetical protein